MEAPGHRTYLATDFRTLMTLEFRKWFVVLLCIFPNFLHVSRNQWSAYIFSTLIYARCIDVQNLKLLKTKYLGLIFPRSCLKTRSILATGFVYKSMGSIIFLRMFSTYFIVSTKILFLISLRMSTSNTKLHCFSWELHVASSSQTTIYMQTRTAQ